MKGRIQWFSVCNPNVFIERNVKHIDMIPQGSGNRNKIQNHQLFHFNQSLSLSSDGALCFLFLLFASFDDAGLWFGVSSFNPN